MNKMDKKGAELSLNVIIVAVILLIVLVVLVIIFSGKTGIFAKTTARVLSNTPTNPNAKYFEIIGEPIIHDLKAIEQEIKRARKRRKHQGIVESA